MTYWLRWDDEIHEFEYLSGLYDSLRVLVQLGYDDFNIGVTE